MGVQDQSNPPLTPSTTSLDSTSNTVGYILIFVGSIVFMPLVAVLLNLNLQAYLDPNLRGLNPQSISGIWIYGPELSFGLILLILSILGMVFSSLDSKPIHWTMFGLALLALAYFTYFLKWFILGLFVDEFPIGIGLALMILGSFSNIS